MGAQGTTTLDFGAFPGANEASAVVTGQAAIVPGSHAEAFVMATNTTADHSIADHAYLPALMALTCGSVSSGVGFTINGRSVERLQGVWNIRWVWNVWVIALSLGASS